MEPMAVNGLSMKFKNTANTEASHKLQALSQT